MPITYDELKSCERDYFLAHWEDKELVMEPHCHCGNDLDEEYHCSRCDRRGDVTFVVCEDPQTLSVVEKLLQGNPNFRKFEASLVNK